MGRANLEGMLEIADIDTTLSWHLQSNHYPPVPLSMIPVCKAAIDAGNEEDWDKQIELPEGVSYRGSKTAPASVIIEQHHLESFLSGDDDAEG